MARPSTHDLCSFAKNSSGAHFSSGPVKRGAFFSPPPFANEKAFPSRPRSEFFKQYEGVGDHFLGKICAHILYLSAPPQNSVALLPIALRALQPIQAVSMHLSFLSGGHPGN